MVGMQTPTQEPSAKTTQRVTLHGISWQTYKRLLTELGDHRSSRLAYDRGVLEITMPSDYHETLPSNRQIALPLPNQASRQFSQNKEHRYLLRRE